MFYGEDPDQLDLDIGMMQQFSQVGVSPPLYKSDLSQAITELEEMAELLQEKGEKVKYERLKRFIFEECYLVDPKKYLQDYEEKMNDNGSSKYVSKAKLEKEKALDNIEMDRNDEDQEEEYEREEKKTPGSKRRGDRGYQKRSGNERNAQKHRRDQD